jgi:pilus assembly protein Flp/PilA
LSFLRKLAKDRKAVTALEYGLIASLIAVAIISSISHLGSNIANTFTFIAAKL